jgi:RNA polymerase sigma-70 factor (ECF subfamily)
MGLSDGSISGCMLENAVVSAVADPLTGPSAPPEDGLAEADAGVASTGWSEDEMLVAAIRRGDRAAEERLYRRHAGAILSLATRLLHSREDAMDVMQDAFVTAFESLADLREPAAFRPWLQRVTVRLVHRRFRRRKLLQLLGLLDGGDGVALDALADPSTSPEARAELRWLDQRLRTVSDHERAAWMLRHIEGFALDEVAEACGCSLATAKRRIAAADAAVREHFAPSERGGSKR